MTLRKTTVASVLILGILSVAALIPHQTFAATESLSIFDMNADALGAWFADVLLSIAGFFTAIGGVFMSVAMDETVLNMGQNIQKLPAINVAWGVLRDLANMTFIFILLAIGIGTILQIGGYGAKQLLAQVIIVAVLINFSLFFTKLIVDISNRFSIEFYKGMQIAGCNGGVNKGITGPCADAGISNRFMDSLRLPTLADVNGKAIGQAKETTQNALVGKGVEISFWNLILAGFLGSIFMLIAGFIFFAAGILLAIRYVVLILLMVLSPLAFIMSALPYTKQYSKLWWSKLFDNVIFAPAYLLLTWISLTVIEQMANESGGSFAVALIAKDVNAFTVFFNYAIVTVFMVASLIVAKNLGATGAGGLIKTGQSLRKWGQGKLGDYTLGLGGWIGRNTVGNLAHRASESTWANKMAANSFLGEKLMKGFRKTAGSGFDLRTTALGKSLDTAVGGIGTAGGRGGYSKELKDAVEEKKKFGLSLKGFDESALSSIQHNTLRGFEDQKSDLESERGVSERKIAALDREEVPTPEALEERRVEEEKVREYEKQIAETDENIRRIIQNPQGARISEVYRQRLSEEGGAETLFNMVPPRHRLGADELRKALEKEGAYDQEIISSLSARQNDLKQQIEKLATGFEASTKSLSDELKRVGNELGNIDKFYANDPFERDKKRREAEERKVLIENQLKPLQEKHDLEMARLTNAQTEVQNQLKGAESKRRDRSEQKKNQSLIDAIAKQIKEASEPTT